MKKVSIIWRSVVVFLLGIVFGMFITIKFLVPPTTAISIGKIKLKGDNSQISDVQNIPLGTYKPTPQDLRRMDREKIREERKEERQLRREERKKKRGESIVNN